VKDLVSAGLDSIKFSINASNRKDYLKIHGVDDFELVLNNIREIFEWKSSEKIKLQMLGSCVLVPSLVKTEESHRRVFEGLLDDILYVPATSQGGQIHDLNLTGSEYQSLFDFTARSPVETKEIRPCKMLWNRCHLTAEGFLTACCVDYDLNLVYSDLNKSSLAEAWNNKVITGLRERHKAGRLKNTICDQCMHNEARAYDAITNIKFDKYSTDFLNNRVSRLKDRLIDLKNV
jgi:hypothetical protein